MVKILLKNSDWEKCISEMFSYHKTNKFKKKDEKKFHLFGIMFYDHISNESMLTL